MEGQARSTLLVARSARKQQVSPSKILFIRGKKPTLLFCKIIFCMAGFDELITQQIFGTADSPTSRAGLIKMIICSD
jgi:hypothetical protein